MLTTAELSGLIDKRLAEYLAGPDDPRGLKEIARRNHALPVRSDMGANLFLARDGKVLSLINAEWDGKDTGADLRPETAPEWQLAARVAAAAMYPELRELLPPRPAGKPDCPDCGGTGKVEIARAQVTCGTCYGLGWVRYPAHAPHEPVIEEDPQSTKEMLAARRQALERDRLRDRLLAETIIGYWHIRCDEDGAIRLTVEVTSGCGAIVMGVLLTFILALIAMASLLAAVALVTIFGMVFYLDRGRKPNAVRLYANGDLVVRGGYGPDHRVALGAPLEFPFSDTGEKARYGIPIFELQAAGPAASAPLIQGDKAELKKIARELIERLEDLEEWRRREGRSDLAYLVPPLTKEEEVFLKEETDRRLARLKEQARRLE